VQPRSVDRDRGLGLVEVISAVVLMSVIVIAVFQAVFVSARASSMTTQSAQVQTVLQNASDRVNRAPKGCDYTMYLEAAMLAAAWSPSAITSTVTHLVPDASPTVAGVWESGLCPTGSIPDGLVQRIVITVASPDGKVVRSLEIVKSDV
jgi:Tfp pilus assembly protein PilV